MNNEHQELLCIWQERNCTGCIFADLKLIGTGEPCCTYCGINELDDYGECKTRR